MRSGALRARAVGYFVEPAAPARPPSAPGPDAGILGAPAAARASRGGATRLPLRAAVLGSPAAAPPVAGALACALRTAARSSTAAVAVWAPGRADVPPRHGEATAARTCVPVVSHQHGRAPVSPRLVSDSASGPGEAAAAPRRGPATPAAARLAARLSARGLSASARGRLAWVALDDHPVAAAVAARRVAGALEVPFVTALAGPRCDVVEALLAEQDLVLVVAEEPDGPLARLAVESCTAPALACRPCGAAVARWLALGGLAGARVLGGPVGAFVGDLADPVPLPPEELAW